MTTDFRTLLENLVEEVLDANQYKPPGVQRAIDRACAALAEREPKRRCIYNPVQIAECGGPCEQGPEHCDCGELWMTEPEPVAKESSVAQPADGEVAELVAWLRAVAFKGGWPNEESINIDRAAGLLERLSPPQPVPVAERLPGPGDCDAEGECYWFDPEGSGAWYQDTYQGNYTHWLPVYALPLPN